MAETSKLKCRPGTLVVTMTVAELSGEELREMGKVVITDVPLPLHAAWKHPLIHKGFELLGEKVS